MFGSIRVGHAAPPQSQETTRPGSLPPAALTDARDHFLESGLEGLPVRGGASADDGDPAVAGEECGAVAVDFAPEPLVGDEDGSPPLAEPLGLGGLGVPVLVGAVVLLHVPLA